jgi:hypothetical protein
LIPSVYKVRGPLKPTARTAAEAPKLARPRGLSFIRAIGTVDRFERYSSLRTPAPPVPAPRGVRSEPPPLQDGGFFHGRCTRTSSLGRERAALKTRRRILASKLQGHTNAAAFELAEQPDPEYTSTSYTAVYWKLREVIDNIALPANYQLVPFVESFHGDYYWKLIGGEETVQSIGLNKLMDFSKAAVVNDAHEVRLPGPLKRRCGPFEVVPSIFGFTRPTLYAEEGREVEHSADSLTVADRRSPSRH